MRWSQNDFHQFSWSAASSDITFKNEFNLFTSKNDHLFSTLKSWFYSYMQPANIANIHFHSLWQAPATQRQKNPYYCFHWTKYSSVACNWPDAHFSLAKNHPTYQNLCSLLQIIFLFSNLTWSIPQYVYDKSTYTHISKSLVLFLNIKKVSSPWLPVSDTTIICA